MGAPTGAALPPPATTGDASAPVLGDADTTTRPVASATGSDAVEEDRRCSAGADGVL